jgi:hypothetical protein
MNRSPIRPPWCLALLAMLSLPTGCASRQPRDTEVHAAADGLTLPECAGATSRIERPADFPAAFPLPPGTVVTSEERRSGGRLILHTFAPSDARSVARFFERELPPAGFRITGGESEPGEAEANYEGSGFVGRWRARDVSDCPGAVSVDLLVAPAGT